ncbi:hypothetical protein [Acrocarpospora sp. B8E8]|uniref:hypothetical protein n=1 Tax=Acrocarpospora sp. B8E8 TaxID=3153572 RepID=UPI00325E83E7
MNWPLAVVFGALGGALVELINTWGNLTAWQSARREALRSRKRSLPSIGLYIDPLPDALVALTRVLLGGLAGFLFHSQVTGIVAAVAVGAAGPALLRQLGTASSVREALQRGVTSDEPAQATDTASENTGTSRESREDARQEAAE